MFAAVYRRLPGFFVIAGLSTALATAAAPPSVVAQPATDASANSLKLFRDPRVVPGARFSVEVIGSGPDVVLIPGLVSSRETWRRTAERLRGRYRLHLVQIAGFAGEPSGANGAGPFFEPVAEALDGYIVNLKKPVVIGHSLGGSLGLAIAERHPDHLSKLFIVDSLPFLGTSLGGATATVESLRPMVDAIRSRPPSPFTDAGQRLTVAQMVSAPADIDRVTGWGVASDPAVAIRAMTDDMLTDLRPDVAKVTVPVTVIYEADLGPFVQSGYAALQNKTLVAVKPGVKHFIMYDDPQAFDAALDAFLAK